MQLAGAAVVLAAVAGVPDRAVAHQVAHQEGGGGGGVSEDRTLDRLLAEHLFGWTWLTRLSSVWFGPSEMVGQRDDYGVVRKADDYDLIENTREDDWWMRDEAQVADCPVVPRYSSTGDGMLLVIEAMRARGYSTLLEVFSGLDKQPRVRAMFSDEKGMGMERGVDAPRAVALAALAAMGVEVEG